MALQTDTSILHEIVRVVESRARVPDRVRVRGYEYQIIYLDDHKQRLEETLRRRDPDRLNMLYGQMASKVKYQVLRRLPTRLQRISERQSSGKKPSGPAAAPRKPVAPAGKRPTLAGKSAKTPVSRSVGSKKPASKKKSRAAVKGGQGKKSRIARAARN